MPGVLPCTLGRCLKELYRRRAECTNVTAALLIVGKLETSPMFNLKQQSKLSWSGSGLFSDYPAWPPWPPCCSLSIPSKSHLIAFVFVVPVPRTLISSISRSFSHLLWPSAWLSPSQSSVFWPLIENDHFGTYSLILYPACHHSLNLCSHKLRWSPECASVRISFKVLAWAQTVTDNCKKSLSGPPSQKGWWWKDRLQTVRTSGFGTWHCCILTLWLWTSLWTS